MRAIVLLFVLLFGSAWVSAQPYRPILSDSNFWYSSYEKAGIVQTDYYYADQDTVIGGNNYKILELYHFNGNCFIREDTATRKVYFRQPVGYKANQDILLYDFSMIPGQTMFLYNPRTPFGDSSGLYFLDSITQGWLADSTQTRVFHLHSTAEESIEWIEGIGGKTLVNSPAIGDENYLKLSLSCLYKKGVLKYQSGRSVEFDKCDINTIAVQEHDNAGGLIVYPNPAETYIVVEWEKEISGELEIVNSSGKVVLNVPIENLKSLRIPLEKFISPGIYYTRLTGKDILISSKFFVVK